MNQELIDYLIKCKEEDLKKRGNILIRDYYDRIYYLKDAPIFFNSKSLAIVSTDISITDLLGML